MEYLSDVQLKRCIAWMRLELLAWLCLCADALVSVWAPSVWDTGHIYGLFVVVVLVSGLAAVVLSWVRNPMRWNLTVLYISTYVKRFYNHLGTFKQISACKRFDR